MVLKWISQFLGVKIALFDTSPLNFLPKSCKILLKKCTHQHNWEALDDESKKTLLGTTWDASHSSGHSFQTIKKLPPFSTELIQRPPPLRIIQAVSLLWPRIPWWRWGAWSRWQLSGSPGWTRELPVGRRSPRGPYCTLATPANNATESQQRRECSLLEISGYARRAGSAHLEQ